MWWRYCFALLLLTAYVGGEVTSFSSSYVHQPQTESPAATSSCESIGSCKKNDDCSKTGFGMKCVRGTCNCPIGTLLIKGQCTQEKKMGASCRVSAECFGMNGFCNEIIGKCTCIPGLYEYKGNCHGGYKADVGYQLVLNMFTLDTLAFLISDKDQEFSLHFEETAIRRVVTVYFNKNSLVNNETRNSVGIMNGETSTLCEADIDPLTNLFKVNLLGPHYELEVFTSDGFSYKKVCSQINVLFTLRPTHVTIMRSGDKATEDMLFYPLSKEIRLVYGNLGEICLNDHDCKEASSVCDAMGLCDCASGFIVYEGHCVEQTRFLGQSCIAKDQCSVRFSTCTGRGVCSCSRGYVQQSSTSCVKQDSRL